LQWVDTLEAANITTARHRTPVLHVRLAVLLYYRGTRIGPMELSRTQFLQPANPPENCFHRDVLCTTKRPHSSPKTGAQDGRGFFSLGPTTVPSR